MRQGRLDKFPSGNGSNGFREIRRETHSDVLDENLLQRLARVEWENEKGRAAAAGAQHNQRIKRGKKSKLTATFNAKWIRERRRVERDKRERERESVWVGWVG